MSHATAGSAANRPHLGDALDPPLAGVADDPTGAATDRRAYLTGGDSTHRAAAQILLAQLTAAGAAPA